MSLTNTVQSFGAVTKTFHWITALLIFAAFPIGLIASDLSHQIMAPGAAPTAADQARVVFLFSVHKTLGVSVFFVALARIAWAVTQPRPGLLNQDKPAESALADFIHWLLYGCLVLVPLTGWVHHAATTGFAPIWWPFGQTLPFVPQSDRVAEIAGAVHWGLTKLLLIAILLHIAGAVKHHVIDQDATLRRMLPGSAPLPYVAPHQFHILPPMAAGVITLATMAGGGLIGLNASTETIQPAASLDRVASDWQVQEGSLGLTITQMGNTVAGQFDDWTAAISFDPNTNTGQVDVTIAIPSLSLGSVTAQAMQADYFDAEAHPTARFQGEIEKRETAYAAPGVLTIKGINVPATLDFTLDLAGETAKAQGQMTVNRTEFNIGSGIADANTLGILVETTFDLTAIRATSDL